MRINFHKYQGAGNDFILCDDRDDTILPQLDRDTIARLCDRHFGIGADGLMLLRTAAAPHDFEMVYYNSDGGGNTLCGNGGRCIVRFAADLGMERGVYRFLASDGPHEATLTPSGEVALSMNEVSDIQQHGDDLVLDTGSPHYLRFLPSLEGIDVVDEGRSIRQSAAFAERGINVNFVAPHGDELQLATYERGVEDETLACGTGVTAAAIGALHRGGKITEGPFSIPVQVRGGRLTVTGERFGSRYSALRLIGPAEHVFSGTITL
jgi:diaminopimelate epimerase